MMQKYAEALSKRGFEVICVADRAEAREKLMSLIPDGASIGIGGSVTVQQLDVVKELREKGHSVSWHWDPVEDRAATFLHAHNADIYLASANAVTSAGQIIEIDGTGNRVGALASGPKTTILTVGINKLVDGGFAQGVARIKAEACPPNATRLGLNTPCARTGHCDEAACVDGCMCRTILTMSRPNNGHRVIVLLVNEVLGY